MVDTPNESVPILSMHLKGYVPNGMKLGIACNKLQGGIDHVTEVKVIHNGKVKYRRTDVRDY